MSLYNNVDNLRQTETGMGHTFGQENLLLRGNLFRFKLLRSKIKMSNTANRPLDVITLAMKHLLRQMGDRYPQTSRYRFWWLRTHRIYPIMFDGMGHTQNYRLMLHAWVLTQFLLRRSFLIIFQKIIEVWVKTSLSTHFRSYQDGACL